LKILEEKFERGEFLLFSSIAECGRELKIPFRFISLFLKKKKGLEYVAIKVQKLEQVNWLLPNADLNEVWGVDYQRIASYRYLNQKPSKWNREYGHLPKDPEYFKALEQEKRKHSNFKNICLVKIKRGKIRSNLIKKP